MVVAPAAIAWACNPQANISTDRTSYSPGQSVTVYGSYFPNNANITVTGPGGSRAVTTSSSGAFSTTFTAPSTAGSYVISATRPTGGAASTGFRVAAPAPAAPSPGQTQAPSGTAPRVPSFDSPAVVRSERQRSTSGSGGSDGGGPGAKTSPGNTGSGSGGGVVVTPSGAPVFAGSAPAASTGSFGTVPAPAAPAAGGGKAARQSSATPSDQAAAGYVWSGFAPGKTPSLSTAGDMVSEGDSGPGLGLGIGLLAGGLLALVAGLTAAEVSRRRAAA